MWRVAGVEARMREARSSQGLELVGVITMMMVINWSVMMVTLNCDNDDNDIADNDNDKDITA